MRHFKDIEAVRSASVEELEQTPQMNRRSAESVYRFSMGIRKATGPVARPFYRPMKSPAPAQARMTGKTNSQIMETQ